MTFTWKGRLLTGAVVGDKVMSFTYNDEGIRTSKTVNGVTTTYYLDGSRIVGEETNGNVTVYIYDSTGAPIGYQAYVNGAQTVAIGTLAYNAFAIMIAPFWGLEMEPLELPQVKQCLK